MASVIACNDGNCFKPRAVQNCLSLTTVFATCTLEWNEWGLETEQATLWKKRGHQG